MPGTEAAVEQLTARHGERVDEILEQTTVAGMNIFVFPNLSLVDNSIGVVQPRAVDRTEVQWHITSLADLDPVSVQRWITAADPDLDDMTPLNWLKTGRDVDAVLKVLPER